MTHVLVARLDSAGDVLLAGPAVRAAAAGAERVTLLVSPDGEAAARLLPGVDELAVWSCPWTGFRPPAHDPADVDRLGRRLRDDRPDVAVVLTSDHQSPLPLALLLRQAGVPRVVGTSHDYPGSLLDVRHPPGGPHEVQRNLSLMAAAGFPLPAPDDGRLAVRVDVERLPDELPDDHDGFVVLHPTASVPARSLSAAATERILDALRCRGFDVVVTGAPGDPAAPPDRWSHLPGRVVDVVGRTSFAGLAGVLRRAACVVAVNTGPAHLAAAVGVPVVSLFAPVVPAGAWAPWGVPTVVLGDQAAPCAGTRARQCPVEGHPCLGAGLDPHAVVDAVERLVPAVVS